MRSGLLIAAGFALLLAAAEGACRALSLGAPNDAERLVLWLADERPVFAGRGGVFATDPGLTSLNDPQETFADPPSSGTLRIVCLGDSATRGWPYHQRGSYPRWLQAMLDDLGVRAEVVNAGFHSFDSVRVAAVAREMARHRPSVMIFRSGFNDAGLFRWRDSRGTLRGRLTALHLELIRRSRLYNVARRGPWAPRAQVAIGGADPRPLSREETARLAALYGRELAAMAAAARGAGAAPFFLDLGDPSRCAANRRCGALQAQLAPYDPIRLGPALKDAPFVDDIHPDWDGYRRIALTVARRLCADPRLGLRCRWRRLKTTPAYVSQLRLDDPEFLAHVHVGLALMQMAEGRTDEARRELALAEKLAPNPDMVKQELSQFRR